MKKIFIAVLSSAFICLSMAACKNNTENQPQNSNFYVESSVVSRTPTASELYSDIRDENNNTNNGTVTDHNGIIGDADNRDNMLSDIVSDVVSGARDMTDETFDTAKNVTDDVISGTESIVDNAVSGAGNAVEDAASTTESVADNIADTAESAVDNNRYDRDNDDDSLNNNSR